MKFECEFTPGAPAVWCCRRCGTCYGERCIPTGRNRQWGFARPVCLRCNGTLRFLGRSMDLGARLKILSRLFFYPLHPNSLLVIGLVVALSFAIGRNVQTLVIGLVLALSLVRYGMQIIEQSGRGKISAPVLKWPDGDSDLSLLFQQLVLFAGVGLIIAAAGQVSLALSAGVTLLLALFIPAMMIQLHAHQSLQRALHPLDMGQVMVSLGWPYLWLCLAAYIVLLCFVSVSNWFVGELPARAVVIAFSAFSAYSLLLFFAVHGYVIFEYQNELGLTSAKPQLDAQRKQLYEKNRILGEGLVFMRDGKLERARSALRRGLELFHDDLDLHFQYHALLMRLKDLDALCRHCDYVIALLTTRKLLGKGVEMVLDVQSRVPDFKLADAHAAVEIARLMRKLGHHTAVIKLLMNLHEHRARDPIIPEAYLLVANTLFEPLKDDRAVLKIIEFINNEYPSCPQRPQFAKLKATLVGEKSFAVNE